MTLQARMSADDRRYINPSRDVAHCFGAAVKATLERIESHAWPELQKYLKANNVSDEEMGKAVECLCAFAATATDVKKEGMVGAMSRAGWFELSDPAMIATSAMLGTVTMGLFYAGAKEATIGGSGPCLDNQSLYEAGLRCSKAMTLPRWRRPFYRFKEKLVALWRAVRNA